MITLQEEKEILEKEYHCDNFLWVVNHLLPDFKPSEHSVQFNNKLFGSVTELGTSKNCDITIYQVILKKGVEKRRVQITQEMFKVLRGGQINNAFVAFSNEDKQNFRISLLTSNYEWHDDKITKIHSNPRRYSYSLGKGAKTKTADKYLIRDGKVNSLTELMSRFSAEVVNKEFYNKIATQFTKLVGGQRDKITYKKQLNLYSITDQNKYAEFAVRLIGRIVFCWFLKEKKSDSGVPLVPEAILSKDGLLQNSNYYHSVLEPLFFEVLNTKIERRKDKFAKEKLYKQIPYLNGGLFCPHTDDHYKYDSVSEGGICGLVSIPDKWFEELYIILSEYNFTVDENTSYDIELSIDPEMLGRIFENLLAEINPETGESAKKSTGSFYTPRDIVDYMVDSSIYEYLLEKTGVDNDKLKAVISFGKEDDESIKLEENEKKMVVSALYDITTLDPACGSGAFPIGLLQKIVYIFKEIDPEANLWFDKATEGMTNSFIKREFEKQFTTNSLEYILKLNVIQKSIFGIDIQPIAVEIARLRCFLSLIIEEKIVDTENNRGIKPLPNLDFKFVIANSLIGLENIEQRTFFEDTNHIEQLKNIRDEYFNATEEHRIELIHAFTKIQNLMFDTTLKHYQKAASERYFQLSSWKPFENKPTSWFDPEWMFGLKNGFDIVIANPPYYIVYDKDIKKSYENRYKTFQRNNDIYVAFYEQGINLLNLKGIISYITPNTFLNGDYFRNLRKHIVKIMKIKEIVDYKEVPIFEEATVFTAISILQRNNTFTGYAFPIKIANSYNSFNEASVEITEISDASFRPANDIFNRIGQICNKVIFDNYYFIKDVGFNYWTIGNKKNRSGNSIGKRILYGGQKQNPNDIPFIKGSDFMQYTTPIAKNYLKQNYEYYLNNEVDVFRFSKELLEVSPKLIYRQTANKIIASIDYHKKLVDKTVHIIIPKNAKSPNLLYILGLLNSKLYNYLYSYISQETEGRAFAQVKTVYIKNLPLPFIPEEKQKKIITLVEQILSKKQLQEDTLSIEAELDKVVYGIYKLTPEEISIVESK